MTDFKNIELKITLGNDHIVSQLKLNEIINIPILTTYVSAKNDELQNVESKHREDIITVDLYNLFHINEIDDVLDVLNGNPKSTAANLSTEKFGNPESTDENLQDRLFTIFSFIFKYAALYPINSPELEYPAPDLDFKQRRVETLFYNRNFAEGEPITKQSIIFDELLGNIEGTKCIEDSDRIYILIAIAKIADKMEMSILYNKLLAIVAMILKDKPIKFIQKIFE